MLDKLKWQVYFFLAASHAAAAPLLRHADRIKSTMWSIPLPFLTCAKIVGPPSLEKHKHVSQMN